MTGVLHHFVLFLVNASLEKAAVQQWLLLVQNYSLMKPQPESEQQLSQEKLDPI